MEQQPEQPAERCVERLDASATAAPDRHTGNVSLSEAARLTGASRNRLYRAIEAGKLTRLSDGSLSVQQLLDAGFTLKSEPNAAVPNDNLGHLLAAYTDVNRELNESLRDQNDTLRDHCAMLREQLRLLQGQLQMSQQREVQLFQMVQDHRYDAVTPPHERNDAPPRVTPEVSAPSHVMPLGDEIPNRAPEPVARPAAPSPPYEERSAAVANQQPRVEPELQSSGLFKRWKT